MEEKQGEGVEETDASVQYKDRAARQSDSSRKQFHFARHFIGSCAGKPMGRAKPFTFLFPLFWVTSKTMPTPQLQSSHLENGTKRGTGASEVLALGQFGNS